jgi:aspartyl-tRNA synthetase
MHPYRSHTCADIRPEHVGETVRLSGWVHRVRDHGGIVFIDLRDHYGITQIVVHPEQEFFAGVDHWRLETVICFAGPVVRREEDTVNSRLPTGVVEVHAEEMTVLGPAAPLPFPVADEMQCPESTRLKYRFLELRRDSLKQNILRRSQIISSIRRRMTDLDFAEIQTPILTASSPEGARDFLVPSRLHPGQFYALPQAPQQFKQLLMVSGFDKYFQIAPCFRDEDARADRSPGEFYQLDLEMSFATQDDVFLAVEDVIGGIFNEFSAESQSVDQGPFVRIPYADAMRDFGCDKPDLRNPLRLVDVTESFRGSEFNAFARAVDRGAIVRAIRVRGIYDQSRKFFDEMIEFAQSVGAKGLAYIGWKDGNERSPIAKFLTPEALEAIKEAGDVEDGDVMFFICDKEPKVCPIGAAVMAELADRLDLREPDAFRFCWIVDYPMFELDERGKVGFSHNPFSMPQGELEALENQEPLDVLAWQYDLVCNGIELSSGAIRNHRPDVMKKAFAIAGYNEDVLKDKFGGMWSAFQLGAPPHGGIAPGVDRIVMLLCGADNIRDVIAFPFNQQARDLMMNAPNDVSKRQLRELHIRVELPKKMQPKDA